MKLIKMITVLLGGIWISSAFSVPSSDATMIADSLKTEWIAAKAQVGASQKDALATLEAQAVAAQQKFPEDYRIQLWHGTILSSYAAAVGGRQALGMLTQARDLLEGVLSSSPELEDGLAYGVIGALYARVPAWPLSFRSMSKARQYLETGLSLHPNNPDLHYYYGNFLCANHAYEEAEYHLNTALAHHPHAGRQLEIESTLAEVQAHLHAA